MHTDFEDESIMTDRYQNQTTVPRSVRQALQLQGCDRIHYTIRANGEVDLTLAEDDLHQDPVITRFLGFLESDMQAKPGNIRALTANTFTEAENLTAGVEVDLDACLPEGEQ